MPRTMHNPFRYVQATSEPKETTVVVVTHIPTNVGYFDQRFDILKLCLNSIFAHTDCAYDLVVVDNGSIPEVVNYLLSLKEENKTQHLILNSQNLGIGAAWKMGFGFAQGKYIAYTIDDVYFYPNWLSQYLEIFKTFPKVGIVSGNMIDGDELHNSVLKVVKEENIKISPFKIPIEWTQKHIESLGGDLKNYLNLPSVKNCKNYLLEKDEVKAFSGANGYAGVFPKEILRIVPPFPTDKLIGTPDYYFHKSVDDAGFMRLRTFNKCEEHIGNKLNEKWLRKSEELGLKVSKNYRLACGSYNLIIDNRFTQKILQKILKFLLRYIKIQYGAKTRNKKVKTPNFNEVQ